MPLVSQTFDQLLDFTRTSSATFVGSNGLIQNTPASVNLLTWTQQFDNAAWTKGNATVTANSAVAPDGTSTADTLTASAGASLLPRVSFTSLSTVNGVSNTASIYVKAGTYTFIQIYVNSQPADWANFTLSGAGTATANGATTAAIQAVGNGWYRITMTYTAGGTDRYPIFTMAASGTATRAQTWTTAGTETVFIWGAQLEAVPDANLVLGSELVTNPGPFADTTGWTASLGTIAAVSSSLVLTVPVGGSARAVSSAMSGLTIGAAYRINVTGVAGDAVNKSIRITTNADGSTGALFTQSISGTSITYTFVATATTHYLALVVTGGTLNQTFSVSRASVKQITAITGMPSTYTRNNGGVFPPRFDYDPVTLAAKGLLIEEQRTNLILQSQTFDNASWFKANSTLTANAATAPDGTTTAAKSIVNNAVNLGTSTGAGLRQDISKAASSLTYTISAYLKAAEFNSAILYMANFAGTGSGRCQFNLAAGTAGTPVVGGTGFSSPSATITNVGNGWYRCTVTATTDTDTAMRNTIFPVDTVATQGNGTSGILVWGYQTEQAAFATSYIPTVASQVTRTADQCSIVAPNFAPWYNQSEGTFVVEADSADAANIRGLLIASDGTSNNQISLRLQTGPRLLVNVSGAATASIQAGSATNNTIFKEAGAYKADDFAFSANGSAVGLDTSGAVPTTMNRMEIGALASSFYLNGHIRSIRYYPTRLSNAQLQALTA